MNLNTIEEVWRPAALSQLARPWHEGDSWLAGGTWLFSEPQPHLRRLIDLEGLAWAPLTVSDRGLEIAATCTIAELYAFEAPEAWIAAPLIRLCCRSFQASFKIWNAATVGGNICMSLPEGPMISLAAALEGTGTVIRPGGIERSLPVAELVTGDRRNVLQPGDLLRSIVLPDQALRKRFAFRRMSQSQLGRSTALLIGTVDPGSGAFLLTITAATVRPVQIAFDGIPETADLNAAITDAVPEELHEDAVHGKPAYRQHLTLYFAEQIRADLAGQERPQGSAP